MGGDFIKLYKYRSIVDKTNFANYLKALDEGYLWFADIKSLNDPSDSMIYYDRQKEEQLFTEQFSKNKAKIYKAFLKLLYGKIPQIVSFVDSMTDEKILEIEEAMMKGSFDKLLLGVGATSTDIDKFNQAKKVSESKFKESEDQIKSILEPIFDFNETYRNTIKVFSMADTGDNNHLWKEYVKEYGFCIEYETDKITDKMDELKDLNPVIYTDDREHFSWLPIFLIALQWDNRDQMKIDLEKNLTEQLLTKELRWSPEREYRFFSNKGNMVYADIVSGIILHESIIDTVEAHELIKLSIKRKWTVSIWDGYKLGSITEDVLRNHRNPGDDNVG